MCNMLLAEDEVRVKSELITVQMFIESQWRTTYSTLIGADVR